MAYWLPQKSKREVYTDPVVKYGFSRGIDPVTYVTVIVIGSITTGSTSSRTRPRRRQIPRTRSGDAPARPVVTLR